MDQSQDKQIELLTGALIWLLMAGGEHQYPIPMPEVKRMAALGFQCGLRQTDDTAADIDLPSWIVEQVQQQAAPVPTPVDQFAPRESDRLAVAPTPPTKIPKKLLGVVVD